MRHLGNICDYRFARNILTYSKGQFGFRPLKFLGLQDLPEHDRMIFLIRDLDPYSSLARDRSLDTDIRSRKIQFDIICEIDDLAYLDSHLRL